MAHDSNPLRETILRRAIRTLRYPPGSRGLDAGCGIGLQALMLAESVGPAGHVTGLDLSPEFLTYAKDMIERAGMSERISFQEGDIKKLPFETNIFDWAWSVDCAGYAPIESLPMIKELARVVKPGGSVAVLAWSSEKLLPGYPRLEALLSATSAGTAPFVTGNKPESHFLRFLGRLREAGLAETAVHTFAGDSHAPLTEEHRNALIALFRMLWPDAEKELQQEDRTLYQRICLPESPDFILNHPDYYAFYTYSMFHGKVPG